MNTTHEIFTEVMAFLIAVGLNDTENPSNEDIAYGMKLASKVKIEDEQTETILATVQALGKLGYIDLEGC